MAPVNRRLSALCLAPQLLHTVEYRDGAERRLERLESLLRFLQGHTAHVRSVLIDAGPEVDEECKHVLAACLGVCGATPHLEQLSISSNCDPGR